ncbi:MAG: NAD(P)/FAD-dependent oxidoreductase [Sarcina sp.]
MNYDIIIIGAGPAGLAAAIEAKRENDELRILVIEKEEDLGGTLNQCIHCGFGNDIFNEPLTGTEFAQKFIDLVKELKIEVKLDTTVINISKHKQVTYISPREGIVELNTRVVIIATGIREMFSGNISIPLNKFAGIYTVGTAHKFINNQGYLPGKKIVILGTSDTSLIVARRLILEGANIKAIIESSDELRAKTEYAKMIVEDFKINVLFGYRVNEVLGEERIQEIKISKIEEQDDEMLQALESIKCDSLLISVNFLPDKKLAETLGLQLDVETQGIKVLGDFTTNLEGIFAAGGVVKGYDNADLCAKQGKEVAKRVAKLLKNNI